MLCSRLRFLAVFIVLALCYQSSFITAVLPMSTQVNCCCAPETGSPPENEDYCGQPECQCLTCINIIVMQMSPFSFAELHETGMTYQNTAYALRRGVSRSIDYPPEPA